MQRPTSVDDRRLVVSEVREHDPGAAKPVPVRLSVEDLVARRLPSGVDAIAFQLTMDADPDVSRLATSFVAERAVAFGCALDLTVVWPDVDRPTRFPPLSLDALRPLERVTLRAEVINGDGGVRVLATEAVVVFEAVSHSRATSVIHSIKACVDADHCAGDRALLRVPPHASLDQLVEPLTVHTGGMLRDALGVRTGRRASDPRAAGPGAPSSSPRRPWPG